MKISAPLPQLKSYEAKAPQSAAPPTDSAASINYDDIYTDPPGARHKVAFEMASNTGMALGGALEAAGKVGQVVQLTSQLMGMQPANPASFAALVGGTYDVARGGGITQMSAFNRNLNGAILGSLQVAQGVASWVASGAALMGAPTLVGQVAAGAALAAYAGNKGYTQYLKHQAAHKQTEEKAPKEAHVEGDKTHDLGRAASPGDFMPAGMNAHYTEALSLDKQFNAFGSGFHILSANMKSGEVDVVPKKGNGLNKAMGFAVSINETAKKLSGGAAIWNAGSVLFSGHAPGVGWGALGVVGGTYTAAQGLSLLRHASGNLHIQDTVNGVLGVVQGAGILGASMGLGRPAAGLALGAFLTQQAVGLYLKKKQISGGEEKSMVGRVVENAKEMFTKPQDGIR